jgi:hypothetical protein
MATILLSAAGTGLGGAFGGSVLGIGGAAVGRAAGAVLGRSIDQRLMGSGSDAVEVGRIERFRLQGAGEGEAIGRVFGRMRVAGQVIWASRFLETVTTRGGGKGAPAAPETREHGYTVSLALALCEGAITRVNRIWADGEEIGRDAIDIAVHPGDEHQEPDPKIAAVEGLENTPAYRGTAYVVISDLDLGPYGGRVPLFSFEVLRPALGNVEEDDLPGVLRGVALIPGTGEYSLATTPVHHDHGPGAAASANVHAPGGTTDLVASLDALGEELPRLRSVAVIVSWFGDDLRCGSCTLNPRVEQRAADGVPMRWSVAGVGRDHAVEVPRDADGRPIYGGTPCDASVVEAIRAVRDAGHEAMFYPFILMTQMAGNALPDPYGDSGQPVLPWRGRITTSLAPGLAGTTDRTAAADSEVAAFFGTASAADFSLDGERVVYSGPDEWSYRRFILHYAWLCRAAGGVDAFCIGSEMRGLTQIRGVGDAFPAVEAMIRLAAEVQSVLGTEVDLGYAADWSEYFGYHPQDGSGDVRFHLDPLWAHPAIHFVGIDNYMPLSDWREPGVDGAAWGAIHDLDYLRSNVAGGEGHDWFYASDADRAAQRRTPITDGTHGEPWVFRYKDIRGWWENSHHERVGGVRRASPTGWVPRSKPVRFTEFGCAAIDRGTNQPNKFLDPKSSESALPHGSDGRRDEAIQQQYYRAVTSYWGDTRNNPVGTYGGPMVDMERAHAWAWDARPWPAFPRTTSVWTDGPNYARGHWLNGRTATRSLSSVVREICEVAGVREIDVSGLHGTVRGYRLGQVETARAALQPLMLAHGFDAVERDGVLRFVMRGAGAPVAVGAHALVQTEEVPGDLEATRGSDAETPDRVRVGYVSGEDDYEAKVAEATMPGRPVRLVSASDMDMALTAAEARVIGERWLAEARVSRDTLRLALPPSRADVGAGDVIDVEGRPGLWRVDRVEDAGARLIEAVRIEPRAYAPAEAPEEPPRPAAFAAPVPVQAVFLDLPLLSGDEVPHAPHLAAFASPWPGAVAVHSAASDAGYRRNVVLPRPSVIGRTLTPLGEAEPGLWDRGPALRVRLGGGGLEPAGEAEVIAGANVMAIGEEASGRWEIVQFARAVLTEHGVWEISMRLRGQAGTDGLRAAWPTGSTVVVLDGGPRQVELPRSARGLERHWRIGPAGRSHSDPSHLQRVEAFEGVGLRPYAPAHLTVERRGGDLTVRWVRRTRLDGDGWEVEVPLGEAREAYRVQVVAGGAVLREETVGEPEWLYSAAHRTADAAAGRRSVRVAQLSDRYGPGLHTEGELDG